MACTFYLGTHKACWLERTDVPLFVSRRTLDPMNRFPRARGPWLLDCGGFTELSLFGEWRTTPAQYADEVRKYSRQVGNLQWAPCQDWMCERPKSAAGGPAVTFYLASNVWGRRSAALTRSAAPHMPRFQPSLLGEPSIVDPENWTTG